MRSGLLLLLVGATGCGPPSFGAVSTEIAVLPQSATIQGRDGGPSGMAWGHSIWTFGDTVLNVSDVEGNNWHSSSFSITDDLDATNSIGGFSERLDSTGAPLYFIPLTDDEDAFNTAHRGNPCAVSPCGDRWAAWPGPPIWDATGNRAFAFYGLISAAPGAYNFHGVGQSVAVWSDEQSLPVRPVVSPGADHPTLLFGQDEPAWGTAALIDDGMLYAFACDGDPLAPPCYLAQVPPDRATDRSAWRFWDGKSWSGSMNAKRSLFSGAPSVTVAFNQHLGRWAAIYATPLSNDVMIRTAAALTGPWSEAKRLFTADKKPAGAYDANWHPEFDAGNLIYVTYSRSNGVGWFGSEFALIRVALP